jgi:signal transduction histidine kinase/ligand-binding sensor domain-containing protein
MPYAMAQTKDGYIWLATGSHLYRFDGVHFEVYEPASGGKLRSEAISGLLALPDGRLWIGYLAGGISVLLNGAITTYSESDGIPGGAVLNFAQDRQRNIWATTGGGLVRFDGRHWESMGAKWNCPRKMATSVFVDSRGTVWAAIGNSILYLKLGSNRFEDTGEFALQAMSIAEAPDGGMWVADAGMAVHPIGMPGSLRVATARCQAAFASKGAVAKGPSCNSADQLEIQVGSGAILFDRGGSLWITSIGDGLRRAPFPQRLKSHPIREFSNELENFTSKDGLSADYALPILEDREGNIWVGTRDGLDQFRDTVLVPVRFPTGTSRVSIAADDDGYVWTTSNLNQFARTHGDSLGIKLAPIDGFAAYRAPGGNIWLRGTTGIRRLVNGKFLLVAKIPSTSPVPTPTNMDVQIAGDNTGTLWAFVKDKGFLSLHGHVWKTSNTPPEIAELFPKTIFTDPTGRIWVGFEGGQIVSMEDGKLETYSASVVGLGTVASFSARGSRVWVGGARGLMLFEDGRFGQIIPAEGSGFSGVSGVVDTGNEGLWITERRGIIHIQENEVDRSVKDPSHRVAYEIFDSSDGLPGKSQEVPPFPTAIQGTDGRLWFAASKGIAWVDPAKLSKNVIPPSVWITAMLADGSEQHNLGDAQLPPLTANVQIDYTALSLSIPEKVRFKYKLDGIDKGWQEPGSRREASYSRLPPGRYQFHVIACNNDGIWNTVGANLSFAIAPAWFQTTWFEILVALAALALVWTAYKLRLKQVTARVQERLSTQMEERERIARELHDTLLQSFQGLTLHFQRARNLLPERTLEAIQTLENALDGAERAIVEGRDAIHDLRSPAPAARMLAEEIAALGEELVAKDTNAKQPVQFRIVVEGSAHALRPNAHIDVFRIAREAMRNAFTHSQGRRIETELAYTGDLFRLRVRDDGKGIDPDERVRAERTGHWGLRGIRERAERLGGALDVWSEPGAGTEIELRVPASVAYETVPSKENSWQFWKRKRNP